jgi:hypothetical protein
VLPSRGSDGVLPERARRKPKRPLDLRVGWVRILDNYTDVHAGESVWSLPSLTDLDWENLWKWLYRDAH